MSILEEASYFGHCPQCGQSASATQGFLCGCNNSPDPHKECNRLMHPQAAYIASLREQLDAAKTTAAGWLKENAPGGWIDNLRNEVKQLRAALEKATGLVTDEEARTSFETWNGIYTYATKWDELELHEQKRWKDAIVAARAERGEK